MARKTGNRSRRSGPKATEPKSRSSVALTSASIPAEPLRRASLFMNGRSQAVRLPADFRFKGDHVLAMRDGDRVILMADDDRRARLMSLLGSAPNFPDRPDQGDQRRRAGVDTP
jgi:antitoxin VapB